MPMIALLATAVTIAVWQAIEVVGRIQQLLLYHKKFWSYGDEIVSITAGQSATILFTIGTIIGIAICYLGIRSASALNAGLWLSSFLLAMASTITFGFGWIALVLSPYVELHAR